MACIVAPGRIFSSGRHSLGPCDSLVHNLLFSLSPDIERSGLFGCHGGLVFGLKVGV